MADFRYFLNRQGIQGRKGDKGDTGFSPTISVGTDTLNEYKLIIANESNSFETPNLRGDINISDNGGTYLRYNAETQQISAQNMDAATADTLGGVKLSTSEDITAMSAETVVTPANVADALPVYLEGEGAVTITQDENTSKTKIKVDVSDVTATGNNTFTGDNEFKQNVTIACADATNSNKLIINNVRRPESFKATFGVNRLNGNLEIETASGDINLIAPYAAYVDAGQSNMAVTNNGITFSSTDALRYYNNDGSGNYVPLVTQENIKAGKNISLTKDASTGDVVISSTASGGGGATIDDENISTTTVYSSDKTVSVATSLVNDATTTLNQSIQDVLDTVSNEYVAKTNIATDTTAGIVKVDGTTITVTADGTISANSSYTLPTASTTQLGGVKVDGTSVTIDADGVISAAGSAPSNMVTTNTNQIISSVKLFNSEKTRFSNGSSYLDAHILEVGVGQGGIIKLGDYLILASERSGANQYSQIKGKAYVNHINTDYSNCCWAFDKDPRYSNGTPCGETSDMRDEYEPYLRFGNITAGSGVTITETTDSIGNKSGIKIEASGSALIDDTTARTTTTYSSSKIDELVGNIASVLDNINGEVI